MRFVVPFAGALLLASSALAATPDVCRPDAQGRIDLQACADAAAPGSPERMLALINLGTQAFRRQDYASAVRFYDEARPANGQQLFSDASFHAYRAAAYERVGRKVDALADARTALRVLKAGGLQGQPASAAANDPEVVLPTILPILKRGGDAGFSEALSTFRGLPARDWISYVNRAGVLADLDDFTGAEAANNEAMKLEPNHPAVLNTACYILAKSGRAAAGLPFCERAIAAAPEVAAIRDSYATALTALGRCPDAQAQLATARKLDPVSVEYQRTLNCTAR